MRKERIEEEGLCLTFEYQLREVQDLHPAARAGIWDAPDGIPFLVGGVQSVVEFGKVGQLCEPSEII